MRLDTYSGAPVDLAAYEVDVADVIVAGTSRARPIDTSRRTPAARWRFTPPPGQRFTPNDVEVPLKDREGFFVVEARRGDATQQVWIDLTRVGLAAKESPGGVVLYGADLGTGKALPGMRVSWLVGTRLHDAKTDAHGVARWDGMPRARFAIAEWGRSKTFVSLLAQPPVPAAVVGVRTDRDAVRAGERLRVVGFARKRAGAAYKPAAGEVRVAMLAHGRTLAQTQLKLDAAGAFSGEFTVPADAPAGDAAVLATAGGASGGAQVHVDAIGEIALSAAAQCAPACIADAPVTFVVSARNLDGAPSANRDVRVRVVRSPHVLPPGSAPGAGAWGTGTIAETRVRTDASGTARVTIDAPTDGLASTYGVFAQSGTATAAAQVVAPSAHIALAVDPLTPSIDVTEAAAFDVRGFEAGDGRPAAGLAVRLRVQHGPASQEQQLVLDGDGRAHAVFHNLTPGTNFAYVTAEVDGKQIMDIDAVGVGTGALVGVRSRRSVEAKVTTDRARYRVGENVTVDGTLAGANGDALVTLEGARSFGESVVATQNGRAAATFKLPETVGDASAAVVFVRDGAMEYATRAIAIDGAGHARATALTADHARYAAGATARVAIADGPGAGGATVAIRVSDGLPGGGAAFEDAAAVMAGAGSSTQIPTSSDPGWHASVTPTRSTALDQGSSGAERSDTGTTGVGGAAARAVAWRIERIERDQVDIPLPQQPGRYVVSVLKISDDGDVGAATLALEVR